MFFTIDFKLDAPPQTLYLWEKKNPWRIKKKNWSVYLVVIKLSGLLSWGFVEVDMIVERWYLKTVGGSDLVQMSDVWF